MRNRETGKNRTTARFSALAILLLLPLALALTPGGNIQAQSGTLDIYWIDVEGGGATLVVAPSGESLLVDTGNSRPDDRDAKRIYTAIQAAGLKKIDYHAVTHYHGDHVGGLDALAKMIPIGTYYGHGGSIEKENMPWKDSFMRNSGGKPVTVKLGDEIPLKGVKVQVISANMAYLTEPLGSAEIRLERDPLAAGNNLLCEDAAHRPPDTLENQRNVALLLTYGNFKFFDPGDMPWERELELACPVNKMGTVTLYQTAKHGGWDGGGAPALLYAMKPQIIVVNNGPNKGLLPASHGHYERMASSPGIEGIWQVHMSPSGPQHNAPENQIANLAKEADHKDVFWIKTSVTQDGKITVTNSRTGFSKSYMTRSPSSTSTKH
jgi:beta-lactamase superfamily II metal-dependent hydrolase